MGRPEHDEPVSQRRGLLPRSLSKDIDLDEQRRQAEALKDDTADEGDEALEKALEEEPVALPPPKLRGVGHTTSEGNTGHANEDRLVVHRGDGFHVLAVMDGHGGNKAADYLVDKLVKTLEDVYKKSGFENKKQIQVAIEELDRTFLAIANRRRDDSGACFNAVVFYWSKVAQRYQRMVLNCGDCRAIAREGPEKRGSRRERLRSGSWHCNDDRSKTPVVSLSEDHSISNRNEKLRVLEAGAFIRHNRIAGILEPFRSFGDLDMKGASMAGWVIPTPEIREAELLVGRTTIILATDGVWSVMSNQRAMNLAQQELVDGGDEQTAAEAIADEAREIGSSDDITVIVVSV